MPRPVLLPASLLVLNALVWGLSWWPFRALGALGLHPLWATAITYLLAVGCVALWRPAAFRAFAATPALWLLATAAGLTNACFNWGVTEGDVVRVVLLFYLMPVWSMLLAWPVLGERPGAGALACTALALAGVVVVLKAPGTAWPLPRSLPDWLGLAGGMSFAVTNILLLRLRATPGDARVAAMFTGGLVMATIVAGGATAIGLATLPPTVGLHGAALILLLAAGFLAGNLALQYGAARLPAHTTAVVMLSEVLFASGSSVALGAAEWTWRVAVGALLVTAAGVWSALRPPPGLG